MAASSRQPHKPPHSKDHLLPRIPFSHVPYESRGFKDPLRGVSPSPLSSLAFHSCSRPTRLVRGCRLGKRGVGRDSGRRGVASPREVLPADRTMHRALWLFARPCRFARASAPAPAPGFGGGTVRPSLPPNTAGMVSAGSPSLAPGVTFRHADQRGRWREGFPGREPFCGVEAASPGRGAPWVGGPVARSGLVRFGGVHLTGRYHAPARQGPRPGRCANQQRVGRDTRCGTGAALEAECGAGPWGGGAVWGGAECGAKQRCPCPIP